MSDTKVADFKRRLGNLVEQTGLDQVQVARRSGLVPATVNKAIRLHQPLPSPKTTRAMVGVCRRHLEPEISEAELEEELSRWLEDRQEAADQADEMACVTRKIADIRLAVVSALSRYLILVEQMRELEDVFRAQILIPAWELNLRKAQREQLQQAHRRLRAKADSGECLDVDEIKAAIAAAREVFDADSDGDSEDENVRSPSLAVGHDDADDNLDEATKARIRSDFRRVVARKVHPDTSDTDFDEFARTFAAFKSRDYTLMRAFVIRYRDDNDSEDTLTQLKAHVHEYRDALKRLETRLIALERKAASLGFTTPEQALQRIQQESERIRRANAAQSEKIRELEDDLESLIPGG
ncbi:hypothetical protein [Nocardia vinacea]|uniref:hypothetical protein n=1 Tax=Nocardia vinacea TaxID=96468 RepID=UPI000593693F|nr:hypothetical protein [Nocardia vinacea]